MMYGMESVQSSNAARGKWRLTGALATHVGFLIVWAVGSTLAVWNDYFFCSAPHSVDITMTVGLAAWLVSLAVVAWFWWTGTKHGWLVSAGWAAVAFCAVLAALSAAGPAGYCAGS